LLDFLCELYYDARIYEHEEKDCCSIGAHLLNDGQEYYWLSVCKDLQKGEKLNFYRLPVLADETKLRVYGGDSSYIASGAGHPLETAVGEEGRVLTCV